ncbi:hypothetical protein TRFO_38194 [Tritrichomonas foetus]|uniref:C2 domain-containing protein n=1 Tax=Tritrichomonas foetus TaxID=1144522 RepID=A0A1J4JDZ4_9EUKA|nr:hypothetical protein TRFO_38194 [Tritrichomonas foetus]|eukprot:OHS95661.1 hypothetical protein TRFO_38194 [Tritrichomonas foetus]
MKLEITIIDFSQEKEIKNSKLQCQIQSTFPIETVIGKTSLVSNSDKIQWNEKFQCMNPFTRKLQFSVYSISPIDGTRLVSTFSYDLNDILNFDEIEAQSIEILGQNGEKFHFSLQRLNSNTKLLTKDVPLKNNYSMNEISNFFNFSVLTNSTDDANLKLALAHVSKSHQFLQISSNNFCFIKHLEFNQTANEINVLFDVRKISPVWSSFYLIIQTSSQNASILFRDSNFDVFGTKTMKGIQSDSLYFPLCFSFENNDLKIETIDKEFSKTNFIHLFEPLNQILQERKITIKNTLHAFSPKQVFCDGCIQFPKEFTELRLFFKHGSKDNIDLSISAIKDNGAIGETCFFNKNSLYRQCVRMSTEKYHLYDSYVVFDFTKVPDNITSFVITITSFYGQPLSKFQTMEISFSDNTEKIFSKIPINLKKNFSGFNIGYIEKINDSWEFKYLGQYCDCKVPALAAKQSVSLICPIDEDVEWQEV